MNDLSVHLRPRYTLQKLAELEMTSVRLLVVDKGMLLCVNKDNCRLIVLDADARVFREVQLSPWEVTATGVAFLADKMLVLTWSERTVRMFGIRQREPQVLYEESMPDEGQKPITSGCALSLDGMFLYRTERVDERHSLLRCCNISEKRIVAEMLLENTRRFGVWKIEVMRPARGQLGWIVWCHLNDGPDESSHQKVWHCGSKLLEIGNDGDYNTSQVIRDKLGFFQRFKLFDGSCCSDGEVEVDPAHLYYDYSAVLCSWKKEKALVVTSVGLVFTVDLSDVSTLKDVVSFGERFKSLSLYRGFHTRLWTVSDKAVCLWDASEVFETFETWIDWAPGQHHLFSFAFRNAVHALLMCIKHIMGKRVPKDMRRLLIEYAARAWLHGRS